MELNIIEIDSANIAELASDDVEISQVQDALDIMANCYGKKASRLVVYERNITPEFFDLKTGILGEILQKFTNYNFKLAIVGDFSKFKSKNFQDFIFESNKTGRIIFTNSAEEARKKLAG